MASLPGIHGHEGFVQPRDYLRPRGHSHPMTPAAPETAIDRDQRVGLVCRLLLLHGPSYLVGRGHQPALDYHADVTDLIA